VRLEVTLSTSGWQDNKKTGQQLKQQQQQQLQVLRKHLPNIYNLNAKVNAKQKQHTENSAHKTDGSYKIKTRNRNSKSKTKSKAN